MSVSKSGNKNHDDAVNAAEGARQVATAPAQRKRRASPPRSRFTGPPLSAKANGVGIEPIVAALKQLGTGGA